METKRNKIIPIIMFLIIIILVLLFIMKYTNNDDNIFINNGIYIKEIEKYVNDNLYSTTSIEVLLDNGTLTYTTSIDYADPTRDSKEYQETFTYEGSDNIIKTDNYTFYIKDEQLCINKKDCEQYLTKKQKTTYKETVTINFEDYLIDVKNISPTESKKIYYITNKPIKETKLNYLVIDYDIKIYVLNTNRVLGKKLSKLKENYNIDDYPTLIILDNNKIYYNNVIDISDIPKILDEQGFKSR